MGDSKISLFLRKNYLLCIIFLISSVFFLFQHRFCLGWDFSAYVINARYFFHGGDYFEVYRAPMISLIIGILLFVGSIGEYLYILVVSALFFYTTIIFSDTCFDNYLKKFKLSREQTRLTFYLLLMTPFLLSFGLIEGTELLGLAFIQLFLAYLISGRPSGHFLGLAFLSRYNFMTFGIFLLFEKDFKKILKNIGLFIITISPWLIYNFILWGNPLTSIIDSYHLNVISRQGAIEQFNLFSLLQPVSYLLPLFLIGLVAFVYFKSYKRKVPIIMFSVLLILVWEIYSIPFKVTRYMFNLSLPVAFFSFLGICLINKRFKKFWKIAVIVLFAFFLISTMFIAHKHYSQRESNDIFRDSAKMIVDSGFGECKVLSNFWVQVNYYSGNVFFLGNLDDAIKNDQIVLIIRGYTTIDDQFSMNSLGEYNVLLNESRFFLIGKDGLTNQTCSKRHGWDRPMLSNPCRVISSRFEIIKLDKFVNKVCQAISK